MNMKRPILILLVFTCLILTPAVFGQSTIRPGDTLRIWVKGEPELTLEKVVATDGGISYPLIGSVGVAGLKAHEAAKLIAKMLDDGFIREPLVQVSIISSAPGAANVVTDEPEPIARQTQPIYKRQPVPTVESKPLSIEIIDGATGKGIPAAAMLLDNKVYQSNRLGQMVIQTGSDNIILVADGYQVIQGPLDRFLKTGSTPRIVMDRTEFPEIITIKVIDYHTKRPIPEVEVKLDAMVATTNSDGVFKIRKINREYGELHFLKKGYKNVTRLMDFKGPAIQTVTMVRNE